MNDLEDKPWFQIIQRLPRPMQLWALTIAASGYALIPIVSQFYPEIGLKFDIAEFTALMAFSGLGYGARGLEKHAERKVAAMASVEVEKARAGPAEVIRPDIPDGEDE